MLDFLSGKRIDQRAEVLDMTAQSITNDIDKAISSLQVMAMKSREYEKIKDENEKLKKENVKLVEKIRILDKKTNPEETIKDYLLEDIEDVNERNSTPLNRRTLNVLRRLGINTVGRLAQLTENKFLSTGHAGKKSLKLVQTFLHGYGLCIWV